MKSYKVAKRDMYTVSMWNHSLDVELLATYISDLFIPIPWGSVYAFLNAFVLREPISTTAANINPHWEVPCPT